jgi:gliding motility-associated-like protein
VLSIFHLTTYAQQNSTVDCTAGPVSTTFCYDTGSDNSYTFTSNDGTPLNLTIDEGQVENNWDELVIRDSDGTELYNGYGNVGDISGLTFQSSGDTIEFEVVEDGSISCVSSGYTPITFTVSCATCINPQVNYEVVSDCLNAPQFFVDVDVIGLGSAGSLTLSDNQGNSSSVNNTGTVQFGPYANNTDVQFTAENDDDVNCSISSGSLTQEYCAVTLVDCGVGPISSSYCSGNNDTTQFEYVSSDGSPLILTIDSGNVENNFDELVIVDSDGVTELYNGYGSAGNITGLSFQSSGNAIYFSVISDGSVSCQSGSGALADGINYTVACATCTNPSAEYTVIDDCANGDQFLIDVNITSMGDAESLTISDNYSSNTEQVTTTGIVQMGPYPFLTDIVITTSNDQDVNCIINSNPIQLYACPPENDNCSGAIEAAVNANQSCDHITQGTLSGASNSGNDSSCLADMDDDVWFSFSALSEVQSISIQNISGSTSNLGHALYVGTGDVLCSTLEELYCVNETASVTPDLTIGVTYHVRVFSIGQEPQDVNFDLCISDAPDNTVCDNATNFCGEGGALYGANIFDYPSLGQIACLYSTPNPSWNTIQIGESGDIDIQITQNTAFDDDGNPVGNGLDVDFVIWGPFEAGEDFCEDGILDQGCPEPGNCPNNTSDANFYPYGNIIDCSYSIYSVENLTIENALAGEVYILLVTNYSNNPGIIQIEQTNAGEDGAGSTVGEIEVELGSDQTFCGLPEYEIFAEAPFGDYFEWYLDGVLIENASEDSLIVDVSGEYTVIVYDQQCGSSAEDSVQINLYSESYAYTTDDIITCDDSSDDGVENFDLSIQNENILGGQDPNQFIVTYYESIIDAELGTNSIETNYTNSSNPQEIFARIEHIDAIGSNSGCYAISQFNIEVTGAIPDAISPEEYVLCNPLDLSNTQVFDLSSQDEIILEGQNIENFEVTYHLTEEDALNGLNTLDTQYQNISNPQTIYVRVESNNAYNCFSTTSFDLVICLIPEGISPNNDGYNDSFELKGYDVKSLKIYNRYGKLVFSTTNYNDTWEGQSNEGNKLPVGTYFYHMIYDENLEKTGWVYVNY